MEDNKVLTILFRRILYSKNNDGKVYTYVPLDVLKGTEYTSGNAKVFSVSDKNVRALKHVDSESEYRNPEKRTFEFSYMGDIGAMNDEYVYGFPVIVNNQKVSDVKKVYDEMEEILAELKLHRLFQTYDDVYGWYKLFIALEKLNINIDPSDFYELHDLICRPLDGFHKDVSRLLDTDPKVEVAPAVNIYRSNGLYSNDIYDTVSKTVLFQNEQIRAVAGAISKNSCLTTPALKSNILLCGPTGVGKTEIFRSIYENFNVPGAFEDSTEYTAASYKGKDVGEMLLHLYENADGDIEKAQRGILVIDEIDKKAGSEYETFTSAVINSFLKMMEGHKYALNTNPHGLGGNNIEFDTSLLTFVFLGAFSGIEKYTETSGSIGFVTDEQKEKQKDVNYIYTEDTLKKYGLLPEFLGRIDTIVTMNSLTEDNLIEIMNRSNKSQLLLYKEYFSQMGINFLYDEEVIKAIAKKAYELNRGARSIKKIVEKALAEAIYEIQSYLPFRELIITPETIENNKKYILR